MRNCCFQITLSRLKLFSPLPSDCLEREPLRVSVCEERLRFFFPYSLRVVRGCGGVWTLGWVGVLFRGVMGG